MCPNFSYEDEEGKQSATEDEEETVHMLQGEDDLLQSVGCDDLLDGVALHEVAQLLIHPHVDHARLMQLLKPCIHCSQVGTPFLR